MPRLNNRCFALVAFVLLCGVAPMAHADTIIIGSGSGGFVNRSPFGRDELLEPNYQAGATYQQFYDRNRFAGPITITQVAFASAFIPGTSSGTAGYDFVVSLGTVAPQLAPFANFSANRDRAADFAHVFAGPLITELTRTDTFDLQIDLAAPFVYDPQAGDLMLDVVLNSATTFTGNRLYFIASVGPEMSVVVNAAPALIGRVETGYGLRTRFTFTPDDPAPIPEPTTVLLFGTGLAGVAARFYRQQRGTADGNDQA